MIAASRATQPPPSAQPRLRPGQRGNSPAAMLESLALAKAGSAVVEQQLQSLTVKTRDTKKRHTQQTHQRDWVRTHAELQRQRAEVEGARTLWLQAETEAAAASAGGAGDGHAQLGQLAHEDEAAAAARREWSVEMRSQLQGLRELCETVATEQQQAARAPAGAPPTSTMHPSQQSAVAGQLLSELSRSLAAQSARLSGASDALERDLRAHAASILAPDEADDLPPGAANDDIAALAGDFVTPVHERSEREHELLEALGAGLRSEEEAHREALRSLRHEFFGSDESEEGRAADADADADLDELPMGGGGGEGGGGEGGDGEGGGGGGSPLDVAGDYYVLEGPTDESSSPPPRPSSSAATPPNPPPPAASGSAWGDAEATRLRKLEREFRGRTRHQLLARLKVELPGWGIDALDAQLEALDRARAYANRKRAMVMSWQQRKGALARSARQLLQELAASEGRLRLRREEREALASRRKALKQTLAVLERVRAEREAEAAAEAEAAREAAEALAEAQRVKAEAERAHKKALIAAYHQEQVRHLARSPPHPLAFSHLLWRTWRLLLDLLSLLYFRDVHPLRPSGRARSARRAHPPRGRGGQAGGAACDGRVQPPSCAVPHGARGEALRAQGRAARGRTPHG